MNNDLKKLYSDIIKTHNSAPFNFEKIDNASIELKAYNPICGDRFAIYLTLNDVENIIQMHFHGFGCAISKASTSIMVKLLIGKSLNEALKFCNQFLEFINSELTFNEVILPGEFKAFDGVHEFPERIECATLCWTEMKKFLELNK